MSKDMFSEIGGIFEQAMREAAPPGPRRLRFYEYNLLVSLLKFRDAYLRLVDAYLDVSIADGNLLHALEAAYPDGWPSFTSLPIPEWVEDTLENCGYHIDMTVEELTDIYHGKV